MDVYHLSEQEALEKMRADIEALTEEVNRLRKELEKNGRTD